MDERLKEEEKMPPRYVTAVRADGKVCVWKFEPDEDRSSNWVCVGVYDWQVRLH